MTAAFVNRRRWLRSAVYFFRSIIEIEAIGILQVELEVAGANELETAHKLAYRKAQDSRGEDVESDDFEESYADIHAAIGERGDGFKYADEPCRAHARARGGACDFERAGGNRA